MINSNLIEFQKKFNLDDSFMEIVDSLFNKLVEFGYIGNTQKNRLIDKLINNVNYVIIGTDDKYDYKTSRKRTKIINGISGGIGTKRSLFKKNR